jgi:hypothetical protein
LSELFIEEKILSGFDSDVVAFLINIIYHLAKVLRIFSIGSNRILLERKGFAFLVCMEMIR